MSLHRPSYAVVTQSQGGSGSSSRNVRARIAGPYRGGMLFKPRSKGTSKGKAVRATVKSELARLAEHKVQNYRGNPYLMGSANGGFATIGNAIIPLSPFAGFVDIPQGTGQGNRVGNYIRPRKVILSLQMYQLPYDGTYNANPRPLMIKAWFVKFKGQSNTTASLTGFFQSGNITTNFTGLLQDFNKDVNKQAVTLLGTKMFKLGTANYGGTGANSALQTLANNDYSLNVVTKIDVTKYLAAQYHWNDTGTTTPTNDPTYVIFEAVNAENTQVPNLARPGILEYEITFNYTDF